jgi:hypothetical protein
MGLTQSELERRLQDLRTRGADIEQFIDTTSRAWIELSTRNVRPNQQRFAQDRRWDEMNAAIRLLRVSPAAEALLGGIVRSAEERVRRIAAEQGITLSESDVARILARTTVEIMAARAQAQAEGGNPAELDIDGLLQAALQGGVAETPTVTVTVTPPVAAYVARGSFDASVFPSGWGTISENRVEIVFPREGGAVTGSSLMTFEDFPIGSLMAMVEEGITGGVSEETRAFAASCTCRLVIEATFTGTYDVASGSLSGSLASTPRLVDDKGCLANRPSSFTTRPEDAMSAGTAVWKATFDGRELTGTTFDETGERIGSFRASVE